MSAGVITALIGLGGVIGAALIAAVAAIFGPSLLHRLERRAQSTDAAAVKNEATIRRLVEFRTTGRSWFDALELLAGDFNAGQEISLHEFDERIAPLRDSAVRLAYEMAFDNDWVHSAPVTDTATMRKYVDESELLGDDGRRAKSEVLDCLRRATTSLRDDVRADRGTTDDRVSDGTWDALESVRRARAELNASLLRQVEKLTRS